MRQRFNLQFPMISGLAVCIIVPLVMLTAFAMASGGPDALLQDGGLSGGLAITNGPEATVPSPEAPVPAGEGIQSSGIAEKEQPRNLGPGEDEADGTGQKVFPDSDEDHDESQRTIGSEGVSGGEETVSPALTEGIDEVGSIQPLWVRELAAIQRGTNDARPVWSPSGDSLAFERADGEKKKIIIAGTDGLSIQNIYYKLPEQESAFDLLLPGLGETVSYNAGISWSPSGDKFVFMSNAGTGNYDIYLGRMGSDETIRLTDHPEKDGQATWSPIANTIAYISGQTGKAEAYIMDIASGTVSHLAGGEKSYLYPQWSPDGKKIALIYGNNENHDIYIIDDVSKPAGNIRPLTLWPYDDLSPQWSPDGEKIAFYSNYNKYDDPKLWSLVVVSADGSDPREGQGLIDKVIAVNVVPDVDSGPAWMSGGNEIVYVKNDPYAYNPLYLVDITERKSMPLNTNTRMNHDVVCSKNGMIAFRAQVEQWDNIYIAELGER